MESHLELLGRRAEDKITGFKGVVSSISFDLYGCVQAWLTQPIGKDGKQPDGAWFDVKRLTKLSRPVMPAPDFALPEIGPAEKSSPHR
jgi:hypothetical protein